MVGGGWVEGVRGGRVVGGEVGTVRRRRGGPPRCEAKPPRRWVVEVATILECSIIDTTLYRTLFILKSTSVIEHYGIVVKYNLYRPWAWK